jgi:glycine oxidase
MTDVCVIGNGIVGLQTTYALVSRDPGVRICLIGARSRPGCASLAAAAMFNSFCEIDAGSVENRFENEKFLFNKLSNEHWPSLLARLEAEDGRKINHGFGTFLINNAGSDGLEDENFDAIADALIQHGEPHQNASPREIPFYRPEPRYRASRAIFIPREGWVNPVELLATLESLLEKSGRVTFIDDQCSRLVQQGSQITEAITNNGTRVSAGQFAVTVGANFTTLMDASNLSARFQRIFFGVGATVLLETGDETIQNCIRTPNRGLACGLYAAPQTSRGTLVGASNFISPVSVDRVRLTSLYTIMKSAMEQLNRNYYRSEVVRVNVGWRPTSTDTFPLLGKCSIDNMVVATGTKRDGLHCSPVISQHLSDLILNGKSKFDFPLFEPERKPIKFLTRNEAIENMVRQNINAAYQHDFVPAKSRMQDELEKNYREEASRLHDDIGAMDWGIPPELRDMYKYGHVIPA